MNGKLKEKTDEKNKYLDEKLKLEAVIDQQLEQVDYNSQRAQKAEDELKIRKTIGDELEAENKAL